MTATVTDSAAAEVPSGAPRLWISSALSPYGNPYGSITVIAATRDEAIARARQELESHKSLTYVPDARYAANLLENLEQEMTEIPGGVFIDWTATSKRH